MGFLTGLIGLFTGAAKAGETIKAGADIVERWVPGAEKKHEMAQAIDDKIDASIDKARMFANPPGTRGNWFDSLVDGINRLVRPGVTIGLLGGIWGWWDLPKLNEVEPMVLNWIQAIMVFWFGGRFILKDIPSMIAYIKELRKP